MNVKYILSLLTLVCCCGMVACDDDEDFASIIGKWKGTKAEAEILAFGVPLPIKETDETFDAEIEFKADGTVTLADDGQSSTGTWEQNGDKLLLSITFSTDFIDISGTYTIKELSQTKMRIFIENDTTYTDPDSGIDIDGTVKATIYFDRQ